MKNKHKGNVLLKENKQKYIKIEMTFACGIYIFVYFFYAHLLANMNNSFIIKYI